MCIDGTAYNQPSLRVNATSLRAQLRAYVRQYLKRNRWYVAFVPEDMTLDAQVSFYQFSKEEDARRFAADRVDEMRVRALFYWHGEEVE